MVNLDKPYYSISLLEDPNFTLVKHINVKIPRFDGTEVEHWFYYVRWCFIYNKVPEDKKLLIVSFHVDGIARKWFAWLIEARNMMSTWKILVNIVVRKFTKLHYQLPGGKLSKLIQTGTIMDYQSPFEELCTKSRVYELPNYFTLKYIYQG